MDDTAKLIATVLLASFAIERTTAAFSYLFEAMRLYRRTDPEAAELRAEHRRKLALLVIAAAISYGVVRAVDIRILRALKMAGPPLLDLWLTWLILFAGADRVRDFLQKDGDGAPQAAETPAFKIHVDDNAEIRQIPHAS